MDPTALFQKQLTYWDYYKHRVSHHNNNAVQYNVYHVPQLVAPVWDSLWLYALLLFKNKNDPIVSGLILMSVKINI